jgi:small subunit ribosomal protein S15
VDQSETALKGRESKVDRGRAGNRFAKSPRYFLRFPALVFDRPRAKIGPVVLGREMAITKEKKQEIIGTFGRGDVDTGSPEVQVALLTARITDLTDHFKTHAKDHASRRGLLMMVSKRSSLLKYLRLHNRKKYLEVINRLGIRK